MALAVRQGADEGFDWFNSIRQHLQHVVDYDGTRLDLMRQIGFQTWEKNIEQITEIKLPKDESYENSKA